VAVLLISNVASAAKIVNLGLPVLTFDAGTLLFPVSYVFGDVLVEVYGYRRSRRVIWVGFACAVLLSLTLAVVRRLPGDAQWVAKVGPEAFEGVLGTLASGRIILGSLVAYFAGEFSNAYIMARIWSLDLVIKIIISNYLFKTGFEALVTPLTYLVVNTLKRVEDEDYYDVDTDFNPFRMAT